MRRKGMKITRLALLGRGLGPEGQTWSQNEVKGEGEGRGEGLHGRQACLSVRVRRGTCLCTHPLIYLPVTHTHLPLHSPLPAFQTLSSPPLTPSYLSTCEVHCSGPLN